MKTFLKSSFIAGALLSATIAMAAGAAAGGIAGKWTGMVGQSAITFTFMTQGDKITGTLDNAAQPGAVELKEVKLAGDTLTFHVLRTLNNAETKVEWTGKLAGDELKLQRGAVAGNAATDVVATRVKE
jgi:hypothetical protein